MNLIKQTNQSQQKNLMQKQFKKEIKQQMTRSKSRHTKKARISPSDYLPKYQLNKNFVEVEPESKVIFEDELDSLQQERM